MKIAICFSGQLRTGVWAIPAIKSFIGDLWDKCDFFVHTWDTCNNKNYSDSVINALNDLMSIKLTYKNPEVLKLSPIGIENLNRFLTIYNPKLFVIENYEKIYHDEVERRRTYFRANNLPGDLLEYTPSFLYYSFFRSVELLQYYEYKNKFTYDIVVKLRPDVIFPMKDGGSDYMYVVSNLLKDVNKVLNDPTKLYHTSDVYWIATSAVMKKIANYWNESLKTRNLSLWTYCNNLGIKTETADNSSYSFLRNPFKRIPVDDFHMVETFERFFIDLPPPIKLVKNPSPDYNKECLEKMRTYINNYDIIKEICDETGCTFTK